MYLMYVDESGDCGIVNSPTRYFVLSSLIVNELDWNKVLDRLIMFRKRMRTSFGLYLREEIHAAKFINDPGDTKRIARNDRLSILRFFADEIASYPELRVINVIVDKKEKGSDYDPFDIAWKVMIQRFENTIQYKNFPNKTNMDNMGMIFPDNTDGNKLTRIIRGMRRYNPIPSVGNNGYHNFVISKVIEDPLLRDSEDSYFIQAADLVAFLTYQYYQPNGYMKKKQGNNYFLRLEPILCKQASKTNPMGIVAIK